MEEIFKERQLFKNKVIENVQTELNQFGLRIYNANVKELQDTPGSEYFKFLSRKAHEGASNQAKIDVRIAYPYEALGCVANVLQVANACSIGEIGVRTSLSEVFPIRTTVRGARHIFRRQKDVDSLTSYLIARTLALKKEC